MGKIIRNSVSEKFNVIEDKNIENGEEYVSVYVCDKVRKVKEFIGTSFEGVNYTFNSNYVIFYSDAGIEIVFDINAFDFIFDELEQIKAYDKLLKGAIVERTICEKDIDYDSFKQRANTRVLRNKKNA